MRLYRFMVRKFGSVALRGGRVILCFFVICEFYSILITTVADMEYSLAGFNGQRPDPVSGHSHPGNGYRAYNPVLRRFAAPDSWSPFGAGGINPYAWCAGDPVNRADPSGHMSGMGIAGMVMGALGILMAPFTAGQSLTVMSCLTAGLEIISGATAIAAGGLEDSSPPASSALGLASFITGMLSLGTGLVKMVGKVADGVAGLIGRLQRVNGKIGIPMSGEFRNARFLGIYRRQEQVEWNIRFDDQLPTGTRRNFILGGIWERQALRVQNEILSENGWRVSYLTPVVFARQFNQEDNIIAYRMIFPQSARASYYGGFNFAREFRSALSNRMPVVGYRDTPALYGVLPEMLGRLQQLVTDLDQYGYIIYGDAAQSALDELSARFSHRPGSIMIEGGDPRSYPQV
jgi:RHS repeat-associated protein